jgi:hypothetical protein
VLEARWLHGLASNSGDSVAHQPVHRQQPNRPARKKCDRRVHAQAHSSTQHADAGNADTHAHTRTHAYTHTHTQTHPAICKQGRTPTTTRHMQRSCGEKPAAHVLLYRLLRARSHPRLLTGATKPRRHLRGGVVTEWHGLANQSRVCVRATSRLHCGTRG